MSAIFYLSRKNLQGHAASGLICIFSVAVGVCSLLLITLLSSLGSGVVSSELSRSGIDSLLIRKDGNASISHPVLWSLDQNEDVAQYTQLVMASTTVKDSDLSCVAWAIDENADSLIAIEAVAGRKFQKNDYNLLSFVCMVDEELAQQLEPGGSALGNQYPFFLNGEYHRFTVVGIVRTGGGLMQNFTGLIPRMVYFPQKTYTALTGVTTPKYVAVRLCENAEGAENRLMLQLNALDSEIQFTDLASQKESLVKIMNAVQVILAVIGAISVLVSAMGIMAVSVLSVQTRKNEIGIKMSVGAGRATIFAETLAETFLIAALGGAIGTAVALTGFGIFASALGWSAEAGVRPMQIVLINLGIIGICELFSFFPAWKSARIQPSQILSAN